MLSRSWLAAGAVALLAFSHYQAYDLGAGHEKTKAALEARKVADAAETRRVRELQDNQDKADRIQANALNELENRHRGELDAFSRTAERLREQIRTADADKKRDTAGIPDGAAGAKNPGDLLAVVLDRCISRVGELAAIADERAVKRAGAEALYNSVRGTGQ